MGQIDNLAQGDLAEIRRDIRALQYATNQNNMAIGRDGLAVYDGGMITIENGGLRVTGSAEIIGSLIASGTITFTGTVSISGPLTISGDTDITGDVTVTGPTHLNGTTDIAGNTTVTGDLTVNGPMKTTGTLSVEGVTTLKNDLNVAAGGKIKAGDTEINPDGTIEFGAGLTITPDNGFGTAAIMAGASQIQLTPADPIYGAQFTGGAYFQGRVSAMDLRLNSLPTTTQPANLYIDSSGFVFKSTA